MSTKKIFVIAITSFLALTLIAGIIGGIIYFRVQGGPKEKEPVRFPYELGEIYANLKDSKRILKCNIVIEVMDKELVEKLDSKRFLINNAINEIIRGKIEEDVEGSEGQKSLQKEITDKLTELFQTDDITNVYFNELIVQ